MDEFRRNEQGQLEIFSCGKWFTADEMRAHSCASVNQDFRAERYSTAGGMMGLGYVDEIMPDPRDYK